MTPLCLVAASTLDRATVVDAFNGGYRGYEVPTHLDEATFAFMVQFSDIDLARSIIAYEGETLAGMAMVALRGERSWIGGMGVLPEFRGRGYGAVLMNAAMANAREAGATIMHLEVLVGNSAAIRIYESLGFTRTRRLVVWLVEPGSAVAAAGDTTLAMLDATAALAAIDRWTDPAPWQRARESIAHLSPPPSALGVERAGTLAGAVVYRPVPERVSVLALGAAESRRAETLQTLVDGVRALHPAVPMRFLNLPEGDPAEPIFERLGARAEARQLEMVRPL